MGIEERPQQPAIVVGLLFAEHVAREAMELKVRHPLRDNEAHAALFAVADGELLCRCHLPAGWRSTPDLLADVLAALVCDEAFVLDEARQDSAGHGSAVEVLWAAATGDNAHSILPYGVEGGSATWATARRFGSGAADASGAAAVFEAMSSGFDDQSAVLDRGAALEKFGRLGVDVMFGDDAAAVFDVDHGDPCPCGSGLRFGDCHDV